MIYAYFNDCLPKNYVLQTYAIALEETARGYKEVVSHLSTEEKHTLGGVITNNEKSLYILDGVQITLEQCIKAIDDRDVRNYLWALMVNYPETAYFTSDVNDDAILIENFHLTFGDDEQNAINLILAKKNDSFLFSLNLDETLSKKQIEVHGLSGSVYVDNLYGQDAENVEYIESVIHHAYWRGLDTERQIEVLLQHVVKHSAYETEFSKLSNDEQLAVLNTWKEAKDNNILSPFWVDNDVIRQSKGPEKNAKQVGPVYELRVRKPRELRVYFQYVSETFFLLDIGKKGPMQELDIKRAFEKAKKLRGIK